MKMSHAFLLCFVLACFATGQDLVKTDGINTELHRANIGKVTFMERLIPIESYSETHFLRSYDLKEPGDLNIRVFMANSLTNYLHALAPDLTAEELTKRGNYRLSFYVDDRPIYDENLIVGAGSSETKNVRTILRTPLISSTNEDHWGRYMWTRFMLNGGEEALTAGDHRLKIDIRPYIKNPDLKIGDLIASGELVLKVVKPKIDERLIPVQPIAPNSGWKISKDSYDKEKIKELNRRIAENLFKEITSVVVIKNGKLMIEEYFNGAGRETMNDTRSVGKSFASALMGIAIADGHVRSEDQPITDFYDLTKFSNYSAKKRDVTIKSLLTMSSGFLGNDEDGSSPGNEENMYPTADWVRFALDLPMDDNKVPGKSWSYFTAGVVVLGDMIDRSVPGGMKKYAETKLFNPLGISKYQWQFTPQSVPSTAGGLRMRSLDFAKFGQLYKNGGTWNGKQVIPKKWVDKSFDKYLSIPSDPNSYYGYLFWNITYKVNGTSYEAYYATGNGGNKIFVFKDQPLVIVITATAYNRPYGHRQVNRMMENYILPAVISR